TGYGVRESSACRASGKGRSAGKPAGSAGRESPVWRRGLSRYNQQITLPAAPVQPKTPAGLIPPMLSDVSALIAHNPAALHRGVAVLDADGDGRFEFVVAGCGGPNRVLRWAGGRLRDVRLPALAEGHRRAVGLAAGDLDGDGEEELYVLGDGADDRLWKRHPDGRWEDLFDRRSGAARPPAGRGVAAVDRRGVGRHGFFVAGAGRPR